MTAIRDSIQRCNTSPLVDYIADRGLTAYGQDSDSDLNDRNDDRIRLLKNIVQHPAGTPLSYLVHYCLKGVSSSTFTGLYDVSGSSHDPTDAGSDRIYSNGEYVPLDGSDADYQFAYRFVTDLEAETPLITLERTDDDRIWVQPTPDLVDLISGGITETPGSENELIYDREFCRKLLEAKRSDLKRLTETEKEHLARSLRRYISRTNDYRLVFDVSFSHGSTRDTRRMEKPYATRFTDEGRQNKAFAKLQSALEEGYSDADNAVFCTLTTAPRDHDSLWDAISDINENFHRLTQFMKRDPSTVDNTRRSRVPQWCLAFDSGQFSGFPDPDQTLVSGRPRQKLDYVKVLEFTEAGYPHLHVLFFDVPTRDSDGMPWLIDKKELSHYWDKYGQGRIVDLHPLVYRDDLDEIDGVTFGNEVARDPSGDVRRHDDGTPIYEPVDEGFVSWYRYGDHDHSEEWVAEKVQQHKEDGLIDMDGDADLVQQKTAGAYIGKYVSEMYGQLLENQDAPTIAGDGGLDDDTEAPMWKLALYWVTNRRFWSLSRDLEKEIALDDDRANIRRGVKDATQTTLERLTDQHAQQHALLDRSTQQRRSSHLRRLVDDLVKGLELSDSGRDDWTLAQIDYLGTYHWDDVPRSPHQSLDPADLEAAVYDPDEPIRLASRGDRPPPIKDTLEAS